MNVKIVEFRNGRPFIVVVDGRYGGYDDYDFEWSKKYKRCLYHLSGGGGRTHTITEDEYWAADDTVFDIYPGRGSIRREHYDPTKLFEDNWECEVEYCSQCDDWIDVDEPCVHLHWHDELGWWVEVTYCCDELLKELGFDFDVDTGKVEDWGKELDKCPFCGGLPTYGREG